jgi:hypothetical protein
MQLFFLLLALSISPAFGVRRALVNPICPKPHKTIFSVYGHIDTQAMHRDYDNYYIQLWNIGELCVGPLASNHEPPNWVTFNCKCTGADKTISLDCEKPLSLAQELYDEFLLLCRSRCICNPWNKDLDPYDNVVRAARGQPLLSERPKTLSTKLKEKLEEKFEAAKKSIVDKCKRKCMGAQSCRRTFEKSRCGPLVCRMNSEWESSRSFGRCEPPDLATWWTGSVDLTNVGKRDVASSLVHRPCACNATYISHACCLADSGLVWEAAAGKLGKLSTGLRGGL